MIEDLTQATAAPKRIWTRWLALSAFGATLAFLLALMFVGPANAGIALIILAVGMALVFAGLNHPTIAVALLLIAAFFRLALPSGILPVDAFVLAFAGVLLAAILAIARRANQLPQFGAVEAMMVLYLTWNIGSALAPHTYPAIVPSTGAEFEIWRFILTGTILPFTLYVVGRFVFDRESAIRRLLWILLGLAGYSAAVSIAQFTVPALVWPRYIVDAPHWVNRAVGVFNQPVVNGLVLVIGFILALYLAAQVSEPPWRRTLATATAVATIPAIYFTNTRIIWLIFVLVLIAGALWARNFRTGFTLTLLVALGTVAARWSHFTSTDQDRTGGAVGSSNEIHDRLNMLATSFAAIAEKPITGWGLGRFIQINTYQHKQWGAIDWQRGYGLSSHHNELGITVELGLVGLALWLAVIILIIRRLVYAIRTLPPDGLCGRDLAVIALLLLGCWVITGSTVDLRFFEFANMVVLLLAGIAVGCAERAQPASSAPVQQAVLTTAAQQRRQP